MSTLEFLDNLEEKVEVDELLNLWNWYDHRDHYYVFVAQLTLFFVAKYFLAMSSVPKVLPNKAHWQN